MIRYWYLTLLIAHFLPVNLTKDGQWLLAAGARSNTVSVFRIDPDSGELQFPEKSVYAVPNVICVLPNQ